MKPYRINKTINYDILNVIQDFATFNDTWKKIRESHDYKGSSCFVCGKKFLDGERISVLFIKKGNKVACKECGEMVDQEITRK